MADEVKVKITVDGASAERELKKIKKQAQDTGQEVERQGKGMSESMFFALSNMNMLFSAGAKVAGFLGDKLHNAVDKAEKLGSSKFFTGLSPEYLQKVKVQLESVGGSFDSFISSYSRLNQMWSTRRYKAWDSQTMQAYSRLKMQPFNASSADDLYWKTVERLANWEDAGERASLAQQLGIPQDILLAYLKEGRPANKALLFSDEEVKRAEKINNSIRQMNQDIEMIQDKLSAQWLMPFYEKYTEIKKSVWESLGEKAGVVTSDLSKPREQMIMSALKRIGISEAGARGIIGNLMEESKLDPLAFNEKEGAFGIAQWRGKRLENLKKFAKSMGEDYRDLSTQAAFIGYELAYGDTGKNTEQYRALRNYLSSTTDAGKAAGMFDEIYERSSGEARARRIAFATGEDISQYTSSYNTNYSNSSNVTTNNINMTFNGGTSMSRMDIENALEKVLASQ